MIFQEESGDKDTEPSYLRDEELDDETIGKALSYHCSLRREENQRTEDKLITLMKKSRCQLTPFPRTQERGDPCTNFVRQVRADKNPCREMENETIGILLERQKDQILADFRAEIQKYRFQADSGGRSFQELNGIIESLRREIDLALAGDEQLRRDQLLLHEQLPEQNRDLREAHEKSLNEMEELKRFEGSRFDEFSRRRLRRDTILELTARIQELQIEVNCLNDWRDFKDAEPVDNPTFPVNQRFSHLFEILAECKAVLWECRAATMGRQVFGIHMVYRETFLQIHRRVLHHLIQEDSIRGFPMCQNTDHRM